MMDFGKPHIGLLPLGKIPDISVRTLSANISAHLGISVKILPPGETPEYAYDKNRLQYDAGKILSGLETQIDYKTQKVIALCDIDLFIPVLTHVYGEARQDGRCALVSLFRLNAGPSPGQQLSSQTLERAIRVAFHEIGHLFNLFHCDNHCCLMHFSYDLEQLDKKPLGFCRYCLKFFKDVIR
jgi:archaemetzincin